MITKILDVYVSRFNVLHNSIVSCNNSSLRSTCFACLTLTNRCCLFMNIFRLFHIDALLDIDEKELTTKPYHSLITVVSVRNKSVAVVIPIILN